MAIALPDDNCVDVFTQDCGFIAIVDEQRRVRGYNVLAGGGMGMSHRKADTFARLGTVIGHLTPEHAVETVRVFIEIFRDFGNREDRRHARLRYLIEEHGIDWFISEFHRRAGFPLDPSVDTGPISQQDHLGWAAQRDGTWSYGLVVENGRLRDDAESQMFTGVGAAIRAIRPGVRLTPQQNLLLTDIAFAGRAPGVYDLHVGGGLGGDRLVDLLADRVAVEDVVDTVRPVLVARRDGRFENEALGDYRQRVSGRTEPRTILTGAKDTCNPTLEGAPIDGAGEIAS